ncbi:50S ribosomal protein L5 [Aeropyrum pernix]|uniref:50S ribosomal protein L5 n=1 Tax=Aeropyrum pernix TaxID=56636 RepID=UPI0010370F49|nr:50S ribosomal protein L5 [Aeropyrum pernix]
MSAKAQSLPIPPERVSEILDEWKRSPMRRPRIVKVTVNISIGQSGERLQRAAEVLEELTGQKPVFRKAKRTIRAFGVRKGENIAVMVTLRGEKALSFLKRALEAVGHRIKTSSIDEHGNVSFGIEEHILIPGVKYDPRVGILGMDVAITIQRPGHRIIERRRQRRGHIPRRHRVTREETMVLLNQLFGVTFV